MKRITLLALVAGAITSTAGPARHRHREFIWTSAPIVAPVRTIATTMSPVTCTANGMGIVESVDTIGPGDFELLTDASPAGPCKTVSANRTEATEKPYPL